MGSGEIDRQIDAALKEYAAVEPRAGLEERILANVRAARVQSRPHAWWKWALVAAALILAMGVWRIERPHPPAVAHQIPAMPESVASVPKPAITREARAKNPVEHHAVRRRVEQASPAHADEVQAEKDPKLAVFPSAPRSATDVFPSPEPVSSDVFASSQSLSADVFPSQEPVSAHAFPSPRPLNQEEKALEQYARDFPRDAKLLAQAQEASANEVMQEMQALEKESTESN